MINSQDIKMGTCIRMDGKLFFVIDFLHVKPGKGNTFMRVKLKNVVDGRVLERRFDISEKLEDVRVERRPYQYLYKEGEDYIFMNQETYDQIPIKADAKLLIICRLAKFFAIFLHSALLIRHRNAQPDATQAALPP